MNERNVKKKKLVKYIWKISLLEKEKVGLELRKYGSSFALFLLKDDETKKTIVIGRYDRNLDTISDFVHILEYAKEFGLASAIELDDVIVHVIPNSAINLQITKGDKTYNLSVDIERLYERLRMIWANL